MDKTQREGRVYLAAFWEVEAKIYLRALLTLYNTIILSYEEQTSKRNLNDKKWEIDCFKLR